MSLLGILLRGILLGGSVLGVAVPVRTGGEHGPVAVADVPFVLVVPVAPGVVSGLDAAVPGFGLPVVVDSVVPVPVEADPVAAVPQFPVVVAVDPDEVVVDWLGVVVVDCDGVTPVADGVPGVAEGAVCVADGLPTLPVPPGAVAVVPVVPVLPGVPVLCAAATPMARMSTNDAHIAFFIRRRSFAALSAETWGDHNSYLEWDAMPCRQGWHRLARTRCSPYNVRRLKLQVADDWKSGTARAHWCAEEP